jgi:hypothetical protein
MVDVVSNQTRVVVVRDHLGVDLLLKLTSTRCLGPFMREEHTLGTAAAELEMPASSLAYYVQRFVRAGLVEVLRREPRAGKPIPVYRATAECFQVPFDAMPPGARDEFLNGSRHHMLGEFTKAMDREVTRHFDSGIQVQCHPVRGVIIDLGDGARGAEPDVTEWWGKVRLSEEEAREYGAALEELARKYGNDHPGPGRRTYITMFGLVPEGRR